MAPTQPATVDRAAPVVSDDALLHPPLIGDTLWRCELSTGTVWIVCVL
jgi:hypothetical protein